MRKIFFLIFVYAFISFPVFSQKNEIYQGTQIQTDTAKVKKLEIYIQASVNDSGQLCIVTRGGRKIITEKDTEQVGFEKIVISEDGHSVGWLADYPNITTSYPIPLALIIYSDGILHEFRGNELAIWKWQFYSDSKQVAYKQATVHGNWGIYYELRDITTERMVDSYDPEYGPDNRVLEIQHNVPEWVKELDRQDKK